MAIGKNDKPSSESEDKKVLIASTMNQVSDFLSQKSNKWMNNDNRQTK